MKKYKHYVIAFGKYEEEGQEWAIMENDDGVYLEHIYENLCEPSDMYKEFWGTDEDVDTMKHYDVLKTTFRRKFGGIIITRPLDKISNISIQAKTGVAVGTRMIGDKCEWVVGFINDKKKLFGIVEERDAFGECMEFLTDNVEVTEPTEEDWM